MCTKLLAPEIRVTNAIGIVIELKYFSFVVTSPYRPTFIRRLLVPLVQNVDGYHPHIVSLCGFQICDGFRGQGQGTLWLFVSMSEEKYVWLIDRALSVSTCFGSVR